MKNIPKLINWKALSHLSTGLKKQASTENPQLIPEERPVTDAFGKVHKPKPGFSGPHLNAEGIATYMKDGKEWCPYHGDFLENKKTSLSNFFKKISSRLSKFDEISKNPKMLSSFCEEHGYHGEPIACLRAAFSSGNQVLSKFAFLAAIDAEDRIAISKNAQFTSEEPAVLNPDDSVQEAEKKLTNFIIESASKIDEDEKNIADILFVMIEKVENTGEKILLEILNEIVDYKGSAGSDFLKNQSEDAIRVSIAPKLAGEIASRWANIRYILKKDIKPSPESFTGEYLEEPVGAFGTIRKDTKERIRGVPDPQHDASSNSDMNKEAKKKNKKKKTKSEPTNPALWSRCLAWAKSKYDVCPSAYCNGAAAKRYKKLGGKWRKSKAGKK